MSCACPFNRLERMRVVLPPDGGRAAVRIFIEGNQIRSEIFMYIIGKNWQTETAVFTLHFSLGTYVHLQYTCADLHQG